MSLGCIFKSTKLFLSSVARKIFFIMEVKACNTFTHRTVNITSLTHAHKLLKIFLFVGLLDNGILVYVLTTVLIKRKTMTSLLL